MSRVDFKDVKPGMAFGQRRWDDAFVAQGTGGPRPGVFIPASADILAEIKGALLKFKSEETAGTLRMGQIDQWLSELESARVGAAPDDAAHGDAAPDDTAPDASATDGAGGRAHAEVIDLSKAAKSAYGSAGAPDGGSRFAADATSLAKAFVSGSMALKDPGHGSQAPGDKKPLMEAINFYKNSVEELISTALASKMHEAEAKVVAIELGKLINSYAYNYGATVEERAKNREIGSRLSGYFARALFDDQGETQDFLERIEGYVRVDEMQEKGYDFWEGQAYESYKPHPLSIVWKRWERGGALPYGEENVKDFEEREKKVSETIAIARSQVSDGDVSDKLEQIRGVFAAINDTAGDDGDEIRTNIKLIAYLNLLWVWYGTDQ